MTGSDVASSSPAPRPCAERRTISAVRSLTRPQDSDETRKITRPAIRRGAGLTLRTTGTRASATTATTAL